jgi:uncharacterized protein (DUF2062 family)
LGGHSDLIGGCASGSAQRMARVFRWMQPVLGHPRLWHLHRRSVAMGVAVGLVTGLIPGPVQMLLAMVIAIPLRANVPAAAAATWYTNPFTFIPLYLLAYQIGQLVTGDSAPAAIPPEMAWSFAGLVDAVPQLLTWMEAAGTTLLIGLGVQAALFAVGGYIATMLAWRVAVTWAWRNRAKVRALKEKLRLKRSGDRTGVDNDETR